MRKDETLCKNPLENHEISADIPLVLEYNSKIHCLTLCRALCGFFSSYLRRLL